MNYLLMILKLVPYIAAGVSVVHTDATTGQKTQIASDILGLATAGSQQVLSGSDAEMAALIGQTATESITAIINALHPSTTNLPVTAAAQPSAPAPLPVKE